MPGRNEDSWGGVGSPSRRGRKGFVAAAGTIAARALEAQSERWFLWLPVLLAAGILTYFASPPSPTRASRPPLSSARSDCF